MSTRATLTGFIAPLLWSLYPALAVATKAIPALQVLAYSFAIATIISISILLLRGKSLAAIFGQPLKYWLIGTGGICGFNVLYLFALHSGPPAESFLLVVTWPILAIILSAIILKEKLHWYHIAACTFGFSGVVFIALQQGFDGFDAVHTKAYAAALGAAFIWALYSVLGRKYKQMPPDMVACFCSATAIITILLHIASGVSVSISIREFAYIAIIGIGPSCLAYYAWNYGIRNGDIRVLSSISFFGHFLAVTLLILCGYAEFKWQTAIAFALIIGGAVMGSLGMVLRK